MKWNFNPKGGLPWPLRLVFLSLGALILWSIVDMLRATEKDGEATRPQSRECARAATAVVIDAYVR